MGFAVLKRCSWAVVLCLHNYKVLYGLRIVFFSSLSTRDRRWPEKLVKNYFSQQFNEQYSAHRNSVLMRNSGILALNAM